MLRLTSVSRHFLSEAVQTYALDSVDLSVEKGEYVAVTGPSGCGKSTLLSILGLLDSPSSGSFVFLSQEVAHLSEVQLSRHRRGNVGFIFQNFHLIEDMSVQQNVELGARYLMSKPTSKSVQELMERLGIAHRANHFPSQLSGGQQQRVAIARALISHPSLLLADEPTGNLDSAHGAEVMALLSELNEEGTTVVMVTHSPEHARQASRVLSMLDGKILLDSAQPMVAELRA